MEADPVTKMAHILNTFQTKDTIQHNCRENIMYNALLRISNLSVIVMHSDL